MKRKMQRHADRDEAARQGESFSLIYAGSRAFDRGESPINCPFILDTREHHLWMMGWRWVFDRDLGDG